MTENHLPVVVKKGELSPLERVHETVQQLDAIRRLIGQAMVPGTDYGEIPGAAKGQDGKPKLVLLQPGADKAIMYFNCFPTYDTTTTELPGGHLEVVTKCRLIARATGQQVGEGVRSCSTMEEKYRFRKGSRKCPECGKEAIIKGKAEYGGGWLCWTKKGGCGLKFDDLDPAIIGQSDAKVENENIHDVRNVVFAMSAKRAKVAAANSLSCMTEKFTDSMETVEEPANDLPKGSGGGTVTLNDGPQRSGSPPNVPPAPPSHDEEMAAAFDCAVKATDFPSEAWRDDIVGNLKAAQTLKAAEQIHKSITAEVKAVMTKEHLAECAAAWKETQKRFGIKVK